MSSTNEFVNNMKATSDPAAAAVAGTVDSRPTATELVQGLDRSDQVMLVTGGYSGLGAEATKVLLTTGATVIIAGRSKDKIDAFIAENQVDGRLHGVTVDLSDLTTLKSFAEQVKALTPKVDVLMNNAGMGSCPPSETKQGLEAQVGINGVGTVGVTEVILPLIPKGGRIINLSSYGHKFIPFENNRWTKDSLKLNTETYDTMSAYQQSKAANILHIRALVRRNPEVLSVVCHPGFIMETNLGRYAKDVDQEKVMAQMAANMPSVQAEGGFRSVAQGAATQVWLAVAPAAVLEAGAYYVSAKVDKTHPNMDIVEDQEAFFTQALEVVAPFV